MRTIIYAYKSQPWKRRQRKVLFISSLTSFISRLGDGSTLLIYILLTSQRILSLRYLHLFSDSPPLSSFYYGGFFVQKYIVWTLIILFCR
ncbi:unnamed protein product [Periconia digitata]|uniref:Uncharacterized protein n=1 Tax=Periconia digitata TaxID=1303443 RepID=A0A9W4UPR4_9PLEO|nr:unnamed protein product [Periconia digitata]